MAELLYGIFIPTDCPTLPPRPLNDGPHKGQRPADIHGAICDSNVASELEAQAFNVRMGPSDSLAWVF